MADIFVDSGTSSSSVGLIEIDDIVRLNTNTLSNITSIDPQLVWYTPKANVKLMIYAKTSTAIHSLEVNAVQIGGAVYHAVYGELTSGSSLFTVTVDYGLVSDVNYMRVYVTPASTTSTTFVAFGISVT